MNTIPSHAIKLGEGPLSWSAAERRKGRYGSIMFTEGDSLDGILGPYDLDEARVESLVGQGGSLVVRVVEARESTHVGDVFMEIYPRVPKVGQVVVLGAGKLFMDDESAMWEGCSLSIGVEPPPQKQEGEGSFPFTFGIAPVEGEPDEEGGTFAQFREHSETPPWLDVRGLYDAHEQTVELYFIPEAVA